ncbi:MAG TPA: DUF2232 domain-containing protein [Hyphomicrobiaceae bacterium]|nr:DUF2232 domain-containing protein [Hyphomicrobiaceae bacterium]
MYVLALGLPMVVLVYLTLLNRTVRTADGGGTESGIAWYPLGRVVTVAALWAGSLGALALLATASDVEGLRAVLRATFERVFINAVVPAGGERSIGEGEVAAFTELMVLSYSSAVAVTWMTITCLNIWLAGIVTRASGRLARPWPDLSALTLPRSLPLAFALTIGSTFLLPPYLGLMVSGFASAFMFAFMLVGLAIIHSITRGHGLRPAILGAVYVALVVFNPLSSFILGMVGLAEPFSPLRRRPPPTSPPTT